jgi:hypothetical protein
MAPMSAPVRTEQTPVFTPASEKSLPEHACVRTRSDPWRWYFSIPGDCRDSDNPRSNVIGLTP